MAATFLTGERFFSDCEILPFDPWPTCLLSDSKRGVVAPDGNGLSEGVSDVGD